MALTVSDLSGYSRSSRGLASPGSFAPMSMRGSNAGFKKRFLWAGVSLGGREDRVCAFFWCRYHVGLATRLPPSHLLHSHHFLAMLMSNGVFFAELEAGEGVSIRCGLRSFFARSLSEFN